MLDPSYALQKDFARLFSGLTLPFYGLMAPDDAVAPYGILGEWIGRNDNTKDQFGQTGEINIEVFTRYPGDQIGKKQAVDFANQLISLIESAPGAVVLQPEGFKVWLMRVVTTSEITMNTSTDTIFRKIVTVEIRLYPV